MARGIWVIVRLGVLPIGQSVPIGIGKKPLTEVAAGERGSHPVKRRFPLAVFIGIGALLMDGCAACGSCWNALQ